MVVLCREPEQARAALARVKSWMETAGLELHPEKTKLVDMGQPGGHFDFLGYRFWRKRNGGIGRYIRPKSLQKLRDAVRPLTRRCNANGLKAVIEEINPILRGWYGYFKHASGGVFGTTDGWIRGRLRSVLRKRSGKRGRGRGSDHQTYDNDTFATLGLYSLKTAWAMEINSLRQE